MRRRGRVLEVVIMDRILQLPPVRTLVALSLVLGMVTSSCRQHAADPLASWQKAPRGGIVDFVTCTFSQQLYGVPPERVIGTQLKRESKREAGRLVIWRLPAIDSLNQPDSQHRSADRRPLDLHRRECLQLRDIAMMEYSKGRNGPSFQLFINHDDVSSEFAYQEKYGASLRAALEFSFTIVSMKNDWKTVFRESKQVVAISNQSKLAPPGRSPK